MGPCASVRTSAPGIGYRLSLHSSCVSGTTTARHLICVKNPSPFGALTRAQESYAGVGFRRCAIAQELCAARCIAKSQRSFSRDASSITATAVTIAGPGAVTTRARSSTSHPSPTSWRQLTSNSEARESRLDAFQTVGGLSSIDELTSARPSCPAVKPSQAVSRRPPNMSRWRDKRGIYGAGATVRPSMTQSGGRIPMLSDDGLRPKNGNYCRFGNESAIVEKPQAFSLCG